MEHPTTAAAIALAVLLLVMTAGGAHARRPRVAATPSGLPLPQQTYEVRAPGASSRFPPVFNATTAWPGCLPPILNQGDCGSCWAFAASETLSTRTCIYRGEHVTLSPQALLSCHDVLKCEMGVLGGRAWDDLTRDGIPSLDCVPYVSGDGDVPSCPRSCTHAGAAYKVYKAANYTHVGSFVDPEAHVEAIKAAVMQGPVDVTFNVFASFDDYPSRGVVFDGCHMADGGHFEGMHSVMIIGWDDDGPEDDGTFAWLVVNSWGKDWPFNNPYPELIPQGHFWIRAGVDCAGIESMVYTGFPAA